MTVDAILIAFVILLGYFALGTLEAEVVGFSTWRSYEGQPVVDWPDEVEPAHPDARLLVLREEDLVEDQRDKPELATDGGEPVTGGSERWNCPVCGKVMYPQGAAPGIYWCDECQCEYWREGNGWWRCDTSGEPENVKAVTDGGGNGRLEKDHNGDPIPVNENTVWNRYAYRVECPHCGASDEEHCVQTGRNGPVNEIRSPHQERAELAQEVFDER